MHEPLTIEFTRTGGGERTELRRTFHDYDLSPEDHRIWLGTERPYVARRVEGTGGTHQYEIVFRRGGERRTVVLTDADLDGRLRPLVDQLIHLCERH